MESIAINNCINKEMKYYGLKATGLIFGLFFMIFIWIKFSIVFGVISGASGYILGDNFSKYWQLGIIQKWCYWHLPSIEILKTRHLPKSCERKFL